MNSSLENLSQLMSLVEVENTRFSFFQPSRTLGLGQLIWELDISVWRGKGPPESTSYEPGWLLGWAWSCWSYSAEKAQRGKTSCLESHSQEQHSWNWIQVSFWSLSFPYCVSRVWPLWVPGTPICSGSGLKDGLWLAPSYLSLGS